MISNESLSSDWINQAAKQNRKADPALVEKVIRALLLLEGLVEEELDFVFKGGTSLMLLLGSTKRLSIDIDIIIPKTDDLLACILVYQKLINKYEDKPTHSQPKKSCINVFDVTNINIVKVKSERYAKNLIL